jgi:hypothetical protein
VIKWCEQTPSPSRRCGPGRSGNFAGNFFEAAPLWFQPKEQNDKNLHNEQADHQAEDPSYPIRTIKRDGGERRDNRRAPPDRVADARGMQTIRAKVLSVANALAPGATNEITF